MGGDVMIFLDKTREEPFYSQIYTQLKEDILNGAFHVGSKLPSTRALARDLAVGRNTVENAYLQLALEGYVTAKQGSGYQVNSFDGITLSHENRHSSKTSVPVAAERREPASDGHGPATGSVYDFQYIGMMGDAFPFKVWRKHLNEALCRIEAQDYAVYPELQGESELRQALAAYLRAARGVICEPSQVVVTSGHNYSLDIIARLMPHDRYILAMENPGCESGRVVFENNHYQIIPVPVDQDGIMVSELKKTKACLAYVTPSHQFPTGSVMPVKRRLELLEWAADQEGYIIEDDYDSDLRYNSKPIPSLQSLDQNRRTIYTGTFSKSFSPSMRVAYLVLPQALCNKYRQCFRNYRCTVPLMVQFALADFIRSRGFEQHLNRRRHLCKRRYERLVASVHRHFDGKAEIIGENAGIHILLRIPGASDQQGLIRQAAEAGIRVYPADVYYLEGTIAPQDTLLLGFGNLQEDAIDGAVAALAKAYLKGAMPRV